MTTIQLCSSGPFGVPALKDLWGGARNGVDLAIYKWRPKLRAVGVRVGPQVRLDDAKPDGSTYSTDVEHRNAQTCIANNNTVGYVGTLNTGAAVVSEPVLNRAHMAMVSPSNTGIGLTSVTPWGGYGGRASQEPATFKHQIPWVTYYRTVTTDNVQGPVAADFVHNHLHITSAYVVDDKLPYGAGLALTFKQEAKNVGIKVVGSGHIDSSSPSAEAQTAQSLASQISQANPGMVYCGCDSETSLALPRDLRSAGYTKPFMGGDALHNTAWITDTKTGSVNNYATDVGPRTTNASKGFKNLYKKLFPSFFANPGPQSYDATAYDAAGVILNAVYKAAKAHQLTGSATHRRTMVVKYLHNIHYCGATGCMSFTKDGDTTNKILTANRVLSGKWVVVQQITAPAKFPSVPKAND
jgi:branched-chain amino acid transport system substrate-binding protein